MMSPIQAFTSFANDFIVRNEFAKTTSTTLVLRGFPVEVYKSLESLDFKHFSGDWGGTYIDSDALDAKSLLQAAMGLSGIPLSWMFYEEFIILTGIVNDFGVFNTEFVVVNNNLYDDFFPIPISIEKQSHIVSWLDDEAPVEYDSSSINSVYSDYKMEDEILFLSYIDRHYEIDTKRPIQTRDFYVACNKNSDSLKFESEVIESTEIPKLTFQMESGLLHEKTFIISNDDSDGLRRKVSLLNTFGTIFDVSFTISIDNTLKMDDSDEYVSILHQYWGKASTFRDRSFYKNPALSFEKIEISQGTIVSDVIHQCKQARKKKVTSYSDIIVTAPTGSGKSLFFQIPAIYLHNEYKDVTVVISPLVALMADQVNELHERGVHFATFINSSITYEERLQRIEGLHSGEFSLLYLAPELLMAYDIKALMGERKIGLLVIDEAHLVTSWGRDFRVDYWFLGDRLEKIRRGSYYSKEELHSFPILCLTATAVFGGRDDVVGDLQNSLHLTCYSEHLYVGDVRRDNIEFNIRHPKRITNSSKDDKITYTIEAIHSFLRNKEKTIVYFPYKSQINDVILQIRNVHENDMEHISEYHGGDMPSIERDTSYRDFKASKVLIMLATKAFGMGINISDIENVYHFAPTGTLADYVQEIGRAARKLPKGNAISDFLPTDMQFARTLWGLSGLRQYQLRAMLKRLYTLFSERQHRNLLVYPETFSYLFDEKSMDQKVKSGLMLLSADLLEKYHFKVITVRPKNILTKQFINVPGQVESDFLTRFGIFCEKVDDDSPTTITGYREDDVTIVKRNGSIYVIDLGRLWETNFSKLTFAQFKYEFFSGQLFKYDRNISPYTRFTITYEEGYQNAKNNLQKLARTIQNTFTYIMQTNGKKDFTFTDFQTAFNAQYEGSVKREYLQLLLDCFCYESIALMEKPTEEWKFIAKKKVFNGNGAAELKYSIRQNKYAYIGQMLMRYAQDAKPNYDDKTFVVYLSIQKGRSDRLYYQLLATIMQLFELASYQLSGGRNPAIFVRINDPLKIRRLVESGDSYKNIPLLEIEERHKRAIEIMNRFMGANRSSEESWDIIEEYFLGHDASVDNKLGIATE